MRSLHLSRILWFTAGCLAPLALAAGPARAQAPLKPSELMGHYIIVGGEREGAVIPPERLKGVTVQFTEGTVTLTPADRKQTYTATYKLSPSRQPGVARIEMTSRVAGDQKRQAKGLIARDPDGTIRLIYALPGGEEPTEFHTKPEQHLFVIKRATDAAAEPSDELPTTEP
jgi:uncharacterized protein (TIGR03067 family)